MLTEAPRNNIAYSRPVPPTWNSGMLMRKRSDPSRNGIVGAPNIAYMCMYDERTPFDGPVVPDVYRMDWVSHGWIGRCGGVHVSPRSSSAENTWTPGS